MGDYQKSNNQRQASNSQNGSTKSSKEYVNGIFVNKKEGAYGEFFSVGIKKDEFIQSLQAIDEDDRGFINLNMTPQKTNPNKMSLYINDWRPNGGPTGEGGKSNATSTQQPSSKKGKNANSDPSDDLPF